MELSSKKLLLTQFERVTAKHHAGAVTQTDLDQLENEADAFHAIRKSLHEEGTAADKRKPLYHAENGKITRLVRPA